LPDRKHWAVISTVDCDDSNIKYHDSVFKDISIETIQRIVNLLKPCKSINAQLQKGGSDCGIYCLSYCVSLASKTDPCLYVYRQNEMRKYLTSCLENGILIEFPVLRKRRLTSSTRKKVKLFTCPVSLKSDDGKVMVFCE